MEKERVLLKELRESKNLCLNSMKNIEEHVNDLEIQSSYVAIIANEDIYLRQMMFQHTSYPKNKVCINYII